MTESTSDNFGKYRITAELGQGGFAAVYKAVDTTLDREVALKVLDPLLLRDETFLTRFRREAKAVARLNHPHIVTIHEIGEHRGQHFIAMAYLPGPDLARLIARQGVMDPAQVVRLAGQVASALDYAHGQGLIHRDVKPANVLLNERGEAMLTDFGIAKAVGESTVLTRTGTSIGTPQYMAPEQWTTGRVDARSDVYAFGIMVYQMLTGQVPFDGETPRIMYGHVHEAPPPPQALNPALPPSVGPVLSKALAKDPAQRYGTAGEVVTALKAALVGQPVAGPPTVAVPTREPAPVPRPKRGWPVRPPAIVGGALAAITVVVLGAILLSRPSPPQPTPQATSARAAAVAATATFTPTPEATSTKVAAILPMATLAPTSTPRPTATSPQTATPRPTSTAWPTPAATPTHAPVVLVVTATPTPVSMATPVPRPGSLLAAPTLLEPEDKASFVGEKTEVTFRWSAASRPLGAGEYYVLVIEHRAGKDFTWLKAPRYSVGDDKRWLPDFGPELKWQVVIARRRTGEPNEDPAGAEVSEYSATRILSWTTGGPAEEEGGGGGEGGPGGRD